ncbi:hypothetical protein EGW08_019789 [Elysia chlorotica]|uniref:CCHC-type domain-containing protein n=1 Tax=Elysia chlorotica TaxID=188477 RepID=A0A433ST59_ELYCH|nr:hypothetical protein EGW08_019789 [Elysia chlorotica]
MPQASTKFSPIELLYGQRLEDHSEAALDQKYRKGGCAFKCPECFGAEGETSRDLDIGPATFLKGNRNTFMIAKPKSLTLNLATNRIQLAPDAMERAYGVTSAVGTNDYRVKMGSKGKTLHVNLLKRYIRRDEEVKRNQEAANGGVSDLCVEKVVDQEVSPDGDIVSFAGVAVVEEEADKAECLCDFAEIGYWAKTESFINPNFGQRLTTYQAPRDKGKPCPDGAGVPSGPSKRKAVDAPTLLSSIAKQSWSPFQVISDIEKKVAKLSVFAISKALKGIVGEPKSVTKLRSGELLVECCSEAQVKRLGKIDTFVNIPVTVKAHRSLNSSRGVVRSRDLETTSEEEMVKELDGVPHARRIFVRKGGDKVRPNTFVLTFDLTSPPTSPKVGYLTLKVKPYAPRPMRCFKCHRFGHSETTCRRTAVCCRCGKGGHAGKDCKADPSCLNCHGPHAADSKECPKWKKKEEIQRNKTKNGETFAQNKANKIVKLNKKIKHRTYDKTTSVGTKKTQTAPPKSNSRENTTAKAQGEKSQKKDSPVKKSTMTAETRSQNKSKKSTAAKTFGNFESFYGVDQQRRNGGDN